MIFVVFEIVSAVTKYKAWQKSIQL
jgi:hypothetical protein